MDFSSVDGTPPPSRAPISMIDADVTNNLKNDSSSGDQPMGVSPTTTSSSAAAAGETSTMTAPPSAPAVAAVSPQTGPIPSPKAVQQQPPTLHAPDASVPMVDTNMESIISITQRLLGLRGSPPGTLASLSEHEIRMLCQRVRPILLQQPMLLELEAPMKICGDTHGQYTDLLRLFEYGGFPPESNYLFLGDYVDRGKQSIETICLLMAYKIQYPENFFILRGNHESAGINRIYGFYDECKRRYSIKLWKIFSDVFNCLPIVALIDEKILCMHGGLSPELQSMQQIASMERPCDVPDSGLMCDLLWSDPDANVKVSLLFFCSDHSFVEHEFFECSV